MKKELVACAVGSEAATLEVAPHVALFSRLLEVFGEEQALPGLKRLLDYMEHPTVDAWQEIEAHSLKGAA